SLRRVEGEIYSKRGETLVKGLAACGVCHGQISDPESPLIGGRVVEDIYGEVTAPNITPGKTGLGDWTTTEIMQAIRNSINKDEEDISQAVHKGYLWMSDEDLLAVVGYLKSLTPYENEVDRRHVSFVSRNTTGFWESKKEVKGHVPAIIPTDKVAYGEYLVNHVANCAFCHNSPSTLLRGESFLGGGKTIKREGVERVAPPLHNGQDSSIFGWSEKDIIHYLKTGMTPENNAINPLFCPTNFYRNAPEQEIEAIAAYLKTVPPS
ncbi:MAG: cytochrome c, partial [SAR324 cluster bacterium]|nr:cytochrome c [SAR324 cluster bacterium]